MTAALNAAGTANAGIKVRRMDFEFPDDIPEFWYAGDPYRTLLLTALSGTFPEGERFFVDSVRHFQDQVSDPELKQAIRGFIGQEAHHSKEHKVLNELMARKGYPMHKIDNMVRGGMKFIRKRLSPERQLAMTCALEHFTAILADQLLANRAEFIDKMDPRVAKIWAWHAVEETEHKAVAFDVFRATVDDEWIRRSQMALNTVEFLFFSSLHFMQLMVKSGHMTDVKMWLGGLNYFWGKPGIFRQLIPAYLAYYKRDFHPWQHDNRDQVAAIKKEFLGE
ncbi:MAG: metal-dependent hydrolase [Pseudomonadota bacterium]